MNIYVWGSKYGLFNFVHMHLHYKYESSQNKHAT